MKIGIVRVSTDEQNPVLQLDALQAAGCERIFEDRASGASADRPGLAEALAFARQGDVLVCWRLDHLGCSIHHLIELSETLQARGVGICSLQEQIDTTTAGGKMLFHVMAALAKFERGLIQTRTHDGLKTTRARGRKGGRKPVSDDTIARIRKLATTPDTVVKDACKSLGISRATFYKYAPPAKGTTR